MVTWTVIISRWSRWLMDVEDCWDTERATSHHHGHLPIPHPSIDLSRSFIRMTKASSVPHLNWNLDLKGSSLISAWLYSAFLIWTMWQKCAYLWINRTKQKCLDDFKKHYIKSQEMIVLMAAMTAKQDLHEWKWYTSEYQMLRTSTREKVLSLFPVCELSEASSQSMLKRECCTTKTLVLDYGWVFNAGF